MREFRDESNRVVQRPKLKTQASAFLVDKGNYKHFMAKEIHEQPEVVARTLAHYIDFANNCVRLPFDLPFDPKTLTGITLTACGTAYYAGLVGKYWFEQFARLRVEIDVASEFRYREAPMPDNGLMLVVSQSGETADTLASLRYAKAQGQKIIGGGQRADLHHRPRERCGRADAGRTGDRRRLDQGLHLPTDRAGLARHCAGPRARRARGG